MSPGTITSPVVVPSTPQAIGSSFAIGCSLTWSGEMWKVDKLSPQIPKLDIYLGKEAVPMKYLHWKVFNQDITIWETIAVRTLL